MVRGLFPMMIKNRLTTSQYISLQFTLWVTVILVVFSIVLNSVYFSLWYEKNTTQLDGQRIGIDRQQRQQMQQERFELLRPRGPKKMPAPQFVSTQDPRFVTISENPGRFGLTQLDGERILFRHEQGGIGYITIEHQMFLQIVLMRVSIVMIILFALLSYVISGWFVRTGLYRLQDLAQRLSLINPLEQQEPLPYAGSERDEITILIKTLNTLFAKSHEHATALREFIAHASHELKTPLMSLSALIDVGAKTSFDHQRVNEIKQLIKGQHHLIETLLMIAKMDESTSLVRSMCEIEPIIRHVADVLSQHYQYKHIRMLREAEPAVSRSIHESSFVIMIKNIIDNAYSYTPSGGSITIALNQEYLSIKDTGKGIAQEDREHIWERFWRKETTKADTGHYGLGLYLCQKIASLHGFHWSLESEIGQGSTFVLHQGDGF